ncbi:MAG TPA: hypothetical protein VFD30_14300 [Terriglobia bacterium]|nr:hypothetical protein [Terriglobia bacterium]
MKIRYLVLNPRGHLRRVGRAQVEAIWQGILPATALGCDANELRLVSVLLDRNLDPKKLFLLRVPLEGGSFTPQCCQRLCIFLRRDCVTTKEVIQHHTEGWPRDFFTQLAVVLDTPVAQLHVPMGIGGPLLVAAAMRLTPTEAVRYLK